MLAFHPGGVGISPEKPDVGISSGRRWNFVLGLLNRTLAFRQATLEFRLGNDRLLDRTLEFRQAALEFRLWTLEFRPGVGISPKKKKKRAYLVCSDLEQELSVRLGWRRHSSYTMDAERRWNFAAELRRWNFAGDV